MGSFPELLCTFFLSVFPSAWLVRLASPLFWAHARLPVHILIKAEMHPEIEIVSYVAFIASFIVFYSLLTYIFTNVKRSRWYPGFVRTVNYTFVFYLLAVPNKNLFTLDLLNTFVFAVSSILGVIAGAGRIMPDWLFDALMAIAVIRYGVKPLAKYDVGAALFPTKADYIRYGISRVLYLVPIGFLILAYRTSGFVRRLAARFTRKTVIMLCAGGIFISLLYLMTRAHDPIDIYFTMLPAYQVVRGGTLLATAMSQYGFLYTLPWIIWLKIAPWAPVSFHAGVVAAAAFLTLYYLCLTVITDRLLQNRFIVFLTVLGSFYFTMLIRYYGFPDPVSLVSTPAFTPLRFGMFVFPLFLLLTYVRNRKTVFMYLFLAVSAVLFFYSFETGIGIFAAAAAIAVADGITRRQGRIRTLVRYGLTLGNSILACIFLISVYSVARLGEMPDFASYAYFSRIYGMGYLMLPIAGQTGFFIPLGIAILGGIIGIRMISKNNGRGLVLVYLSLMNVVQMPYFMGRSVFPTLYDISLPLVLLCGVLLEYGIELWERGKRRLLVFTMFVICGFVPGIGASRAFVIVGGNVLHSAEIVQSAASYIHHAFTRWDIKETPQYRFLSQNLPGDCPLISFDENEYELLTGLHAVPAYNYSFVRGFITSKEQVDSLRVVPGSKKVCVFVNENFIDFHDDLVAGVYAYYWQKHRDDAILIAQSSDMRYRLYELPAP